MHPTFDSSVYVNPLKDFVLHAQVRIWGQRLLDTEAKMLRVRREARRKLIKPVVGRAILCDRSTQAEPRGLCKEEMQKMWLATERSRARAVELAQTLQRRQVEQRARALKLRRELVMDRQRSNNEALRRCQEHLHTLTQRRAKAQAWISFSAAGQAFWNAWQTLQHSCLHCPLLANVRASILVKLIRIQ